MSEILKNTSLIKYSIEKFEKTTYNSIDDIIISNKDGFVKWLNTYGFNYKNDFLSIIQKNNFDDFLIKLFKDNNHSNKVIELDGLLFIAIRIVKNQKGSFNSEQMSFIVSNDYIWSIQEKKGDYFDSIRQRLENNLGIVRKKKADYLLFLILESIIDNYKITYQHISDFCEKEIGLSNINPNPEYTLMVEQRKKELFNFKRASSSLRDIIIKIEKFEIDGFETKYFSELKEQINNLINDIDFEIQELESKMNLIFSIQGYHLNEVIKTLTIFSVIFIPLTFVAGIYGMNFKNMPELNTQYGYFVLLFIMLAITLSIIWYVSKKKWF